MRSSAWLPPARAARATPGDCQCWGGTQGRAGTAGWALPAQTGPGSQGWLCPTQGNPWRSLTPGWAWAGHAQTTRPFLFLRAIVILRTSQKGRRCGLSLSLCLIPAAPPVPEAAPSTQWVLHKHMLGSQVSAPGGVLGSKAEFRCTRCFRDQHLLDGAGRLQG